MGLKPKPMLERKIISTHRVYEAMVKNGGQGAEGRRQKGKDAG
ncbi:MAG: hypothetical protein ACAF41_25015 [Leptolyngbya sp. BL-A-14]